MNWLHYTSSFSQTPAYYSKHIFSEKNDPFPIAELTNVRRARRAKLFGWTKLSCDIAVYTDNMLEPTNLEELVERFWESGKEIGVYQHRNRDCIFSEADEVVRLLLDSPLTVYGQMKRYANHPRNFGLFETPLMLFNTNREMTLRIVSNWWKEIELGSHRDQLSLPVVLRKMNINPFVITGGIAVDNRFTTMHWEKQRAKHQTMGRRLTVL